MSLCQPQWDLSVLLTRGLGAECRRAWLDRIKSQKDHCGISEQNNRLVQLRLRLQGQGFWLPPPPGLELVEVLSVFNSDPLKGALMHCDLGAGGR